MYQLLVCLIVHTYLHAVLVKCVVLFIAIVEIGIVSYYL